MLEVLAATFPATSSRPLTEPSMSRTALISSRSKPATISAASRPTISASVHAASLLIGGHRCDRGSSAHRDLAQRARRVQDAHARVVDARDAGQAVGLPAHGV